MFLKMYEKYKFIQITRDSKINNPFSLQASQRKKIPRFKKHLCKSFLSCPYILETFQSSPL